MKLKFKQVEEGRVLIIATNDNGEEKEVGHIFTPSSSGDNILNCIQVCGFLEAFDLWGCGLYQSRKLENNNYDYEVTDKMVQSKDIQLLFHWDTRRGYSRLAPSSQCHKCFNDSCTCEIRIKGLNPYKVKRASELPLIYKKRL